MTFIYRSEIAIIAAVVLLMGGCWPILPGPTETPLAGYKIASGPAVSLGVDARATASVPCPAGTVVVGGGYRSSGSPGTDVLGSMPKPAGNAWDVDVHYAPNVGSIGSGVNVTPMAVCVSSPAGYAITAAGGSLQTQQQIDIAIGCADSTARLLGGGFGGVDLVLHQFSQLANTNSSPQTWTTRWKDNFLAFIPSRSSVTSSVVCANLTAVLGHEVVHSISFQVPPDHVSALIDVLCSAGKKVLSGGMQAIDQAMVLVDSFPIADGSGWSIRVYNANIGGAALTTTALAVCANIA